MRPLYAAIARQMQVDRAGRKRRLAKFAQPGADGKVRKPAGR
jgi:hypothetical protein